MLVGSTSQRLLKLRSDSKSMLAAMFSGNFCDIEPDEDGEVFIDRDGTHFGLILNYLRDRVVECPSDEPSRAQILREAKYYNIEGLIVLLGDSKGKTDLSRSTESHLAIGEIVDVKDSIGIWRPAKIIDADVAKMLVKIHYIHWVKKWDEWIGTDSHRLATFGTHTVK